MKRPIRWTGHCEDGVKREVRVALTSGNIQWQFKRADESSWDRETDPETEDWDELEEVLQRRVARGRSVKLLDIVRKWRRLAEDPGAPDEPGSATR